MNGTNVFACESDDIDAMLEDSMHEIIIHDPHAVSEDDADAADDQGGD